MGKRSELGLSTLTSIPQDARCFARQELSGRLDPERLDEALLVVSELVTNALLHAFPPLRLVLTLETDRVRIEVVDSSEVAPTVCPLSTNSVSGRGMVLVQGLARDWGVTPLRSGAKRVWAEVAL